MTRLIVLSIVLFTTTFSFSQELDKIYLKDKTVLSGIILKVGEKNIEIDPEGDKPFLIIDRSEAEIIIYSDNTIVDLKEESIPEKSELKIAKTKPLVNGFRTDGYYINKQAVNYTFMKREILMGSTISSSPQVLFIGFRINAEETPKSTTYNEIKAAVFIERRRAIKKTLKQESNPTWKDFHEKYLSREKIERLFLENELKKKDDEVIAVQMNYKKDPFTLINFKDHIAIMIGNFFGVKEGVPRADFLVSRGTQTYLHPRSGGWNDENEYDPKETFSENNDNKYWKLIQNVELEFFPDEKPE